MMPQDRTGAIGIIGLGRMGLALAQRLLDVGEHVVAWNRTPARAACLVDHGAVVAESPAAVAAACATILVIVQDAAALRDVYDGPGGLATGALAGVTVIEMTTAALSDIARAAHSVARAGGRFIDPPVSGSVEPARNGTLLFMLGGAEADVAHVRPIIGKLARKVVHAGPVGAGIIMKLVLNLPLATYWQTLGEALAIGTQHGLDFDMMLSVVADSKAATGALQSKLPQIIDSGAPVQFDLAGMHKDLVAMRDTAEAAGLHVPAVAAAAKSAGEAVAAGWGPRDLAQLVRFVAGQQGSYRDR